MKTEWKNGVNVTWHRAEFAAARSAAVAAGMSPETFKANVAAMFSARKPSMPRCEDCVVWLDAARRVLGSVVTTPDLGNICLADAA